MRRIKAAVAVLMLLTMVSLFGCATKLSGTYHSTGSAISGSMTFEGDTVRISSLGIGITGKYRIDDGKMYVTYELMGLSYENEMSFQKKGNKIIVDNVEYIKEK